ncbi:hypothetical protein JYU34_009156 [Plutella xylostella]|uniref:Uncharacterized protein n=1 Tax=Plutella xylostella TaxID=51655 RepID=A0ABQ7QN98_PLUXY|nr:hypothetical protein JYU34_009156 [Plutella xylostella]
MALLYIWHQDTSTHDEGVWWTVADACRGGGGSGDELLGGTSVQRAARQELGLPIPL